LGLPVGRNFTRWMWAPAVAVVRSEVGEQADRTFHTVGYVA